MATIIPRWEWRAFGESFEGAEAIIKASGEPFSRSSKEVYVISKLRGDNTKIRDELMDIKTLQQVDDNKLEQWFPVMKHAFPLPKGEVEKVCQSWGVPLLQMGEETTYGAFIGDFVGDHESLRAVDITKERHGYKLDGATVEIAEVTIDGAAVRTICVEHEDPTLVWKVVGDLGLQGAENVNYLKAIKRAVGWEG